MAAKSNVEIRKRFIDGNDNRPAGYDRLLARILTLVVALIVYGSLYPWAFHLPAGQVNPFLVLAGSWDLHFDRRYIADILINIALYVPLGMSGHLAFRRKRVAGPILLGAVISVCVELLQVYVPGRQSSAIDVVNNVLGSGLGVMGGMLFEAIAGPRFALEVSREKDRTALLLLGCWVGSLVFPIFPVMWLTVYRQKLAQPDSFGSVPFLSAVASWYVAGVMLRRVDRRPVWLWASLALIPAQFFIMTRQPQSAEFLGGLIGILLVTRFGVRPVAWVFIGLLFVRGLAPFHFGAPHGFSWIPFSGFLDMDWQAGIRTLLEKAWYLGAAIWLLRSERIPLNRATLIVVAVAGVTEGMQIVLPGRTAEITDPLVALLMGSAIRSQRKQGL